MKSTLTGLCKMSSERMPREEELEAKAMHCMRSVLGAEGAGKVYIGRVIEWAAFDPEIKSWVDYYDDVPERDWVVYPMQRSELDYAKEASFAPKASAEAADAASDPFRFSAPATAKMAKQGWTSSVAALAPAAFNGRPPDPSVPDSGLELEWVHGYRAEDCKSNVRYTASGEVLWHAARAAVLYSALEHRQRFFLGHQREIVSFALHPNKRLVATGEAGEQPAVVVWDSETLQAVATLKGFHEQAVVQLAFSADGSRLAGVGGDPSHALSVYNWEKRRLLFSGLCGERKVLDVCFGESDSGSTKSTFSLSLSHTQTPIFSSLLLIFY